MGVDTRKEAVEAFIQSTLKDHVLSEGMPRTSADTQDAYAIVKLLRSFLEKIEALEAQVRAADALADAALQYRASVIAMMVTLEKTGALDSIVSDLFPASKKRGVRADQGFAAVDASRNNVKQWQAVFDAAEDAYRATKEGGA